MSKRPLIDLISDDIWNKYCKINYIQLPEYKEPKINYKISVCTTCMDRLDDLKQTYIKNINDNSDYQNIEWVLLNYGGHDNLDEWVAQYLKDYNVSYYKVKNVKYYSMAHSRNIAFKLATGDIICSVDADHFTNPGFITKINELANTLGRKTIFVKSEQKNRGRISIFKQDFMELGGYDEDLKDYGHEDRDLLFRASMLGFKTVKYGGDYFTLAENHSRHPTNNYSDTDWRYTQDRNAILSLLNLARGRYVANQGINFGIR